MSSPHPSSSPTAGYAALDSVDQEGEIQGPVVNGTDVEEAQLPTSMSTSSSPTAAYFSLDSVERCRESRDAAVDMVQPKVGKSKYPEGALTRQEIALLRKFLLQQHAGQLQQSALQAPNPNASEAETPIESIPDEFSHSFKEGQQELSQNPSNMSSVYGEFQETTHAWAIFADERGNNASRLDRLVGVMIIVFQIFTYSLFAREAVDDYQRGQVVLTVSHDQCDEAGGFISRYYYGNGNNNRNNNNDADNSFQCEAGYTNDWDALVAFFMLGIFLAADFIQAGRAVRDAPTCQGLAFALFAALEVVCAFLSACVAVSYNLYIGEVTDAVEVGVGLLFVRELSARAYHGIRQKNNSKDKSRKHYKTFFGVLTVLVVIGFFMDPFSEFLFATSKHY